MGQPCGPGTEGSADSVRMLAGYTLWSIFAFGGSNRVCGLMVMSRLSRQVILQVTGVRAPPAHNNHNAQQRSWTLVDLFKQVHRKESFYATHAGGS